MPNGKCVAYVSRPDVAFLYREIFQNQSYLKHGVTLSRGDVVLDIGANVGLFAAFASEKIGSSGHIIAVEPLPPIYEALKHNAEALIGKGASQFPGFSALRMDPDCYRCIACTNTHNLLGNTDGAHTTLLNVGVSDGLATSAQFTLYSAAAGKSDQQAFHG
jgi:hypothetical protein